MFLRFLARQRRRGLAGLAIGAQLGGVLVAVTAVPAYAAGGDGRAYVTNFGNDTVSVIATGSQTVVDTIPVGDGPQGIVVNDAGTLGYVANQNSDTVSVIDLGTDTVSDTINIAANVPAFEPNFVALSPSGGTLFMTDLAQSANALAVIISTARRAACPSASHSTPQAPPATSPPAEPPRLRSSTPPPRPSPRRSRWAAIRISPRSTPPATWSTFPPRRATPWRC